MNGTHEELHVLASGYALGALEPDERRAFEAHLGTCTACAADVRALADTAVAIAYSPPLVTPRPELRARTLAAAGVAIAERAEGVIAPANRRRRAQPVVGAARLWLPVAAMLVMAVGVGSYTLSVRNRLVSLERQVQRSVSQQTEAGAVISGARQSASDAQAAIAVLAAPDVVSVNLAGQAAAPRASARALWSRERGMVFATTNLPRLPGGRTYQVWVVTDQGPVSAGLLTPDSSGRGLAVFMTPSDIAAPAAVAVTLEPIGGSPLPTGAPYLVGTVGPATS